MTKPDMRPEPESIWLEPSCYDERCWSEDPLYDCEDCNTKSPQYIRADLVARHREQAERETVERIVAWLLKEEEDYPAGEYSVFVAMVRRELEAGEWKQ